MYNKNIPAQNELPSTKTLLKSTFFALISASAILITTILPAEYGIDPTGVGRALGLVEMAEIKSSLVQDLQQSEVKDAVTIEQPVITKVAKTSPALENKITQGTLLQKDTTTFVLKPDQATEIKLVMKKSDTVDYHWIITGGRVNYDTHGDAKDISYYSYAKGRNVTSDKGILEAAFDGNHGWYWRNRSQKNIKVVLTTKGTYQEIKRVL
jgi:hypothetical protein